ncbi:acyl-CoA reductase-like NAD-dependent aldehyde dehydrogenase [Mycobacterium frederiksbergense]|uniref:Acyl-CoA reductase-like NAD-dependent aldehyde dehydrogenase n=1 Tax=Mycolicibacterium frederiksbergense TaxID=117567 RepID=A0ABT6KZD8_9MYCO|nr:aldehyde dehydrogenase family protein [Mycolicibacterium frederiksbergense]MDH6196059.1 acyl-CoA reductase-like NAD-dependent aldehyde dehydrogenase [Mycolicibacterium frederiksbergense]
MICTDSLISGDHEPGSGGRVEIINPADETTVAELRAVDDQQVDRAINAAADAFASWRQSEADQRAALLDRLAEKIETNRAGFVDLIRREGGKPIREAEMEVASAAFLVRYLAQQRSADEIIGDNGRHVATVHRKPLGVVAAITPWNMPLMQPALKVASAVIAGNTVVLKPAPTTPLSALELGRIAAAEFPPGVVNVLADDGTVGPKLTGHPGVAKIAFTGSTDTGRSIMASASRNLPELTMELGGSDAAIVLADADIEMAAQSLFMVGMWNAGQICTAPKRIYADRSIAGSLTDALVECAARAVVGDTSDIATTLGPVQNRRQWERAAEFLADATANGTVVAGGSRIDRRGFFVEPTIVTDIREGTRVVDEEQFAPILPVIAFDTEDEAIDRANANAYGLGGSVWSADTDRASQLASRLDCGIAWVNNHGSSGPAVPIAGAKSSGFGVELGTLGFHSHLRMTAVCT